MVSMANKRLQRLERNELTSLPAYTTWERNGSIRFSVANKDYNQLQSEFWRLKNFLDNKTSTVRQANAFLKEMAQNTGIKYNGIADLKTKATQFFQLADKIKEYYKASGEMARALDYQKIWEQINTQIAQGELEIDGELSTEEVLQGFLDGIQQLQAVEDGYEGYSETYDNFDFIKL